MHGLPNLKIFSWCLPIAFHCKICNVVCTVDVIVLKFVIFQPDRLFTHCCKSYCYT